MPIETVVITGASAGVGRRELISAAIGSAVVIAGAFALASRAAAR
jgi:hypothetical protein